jgi:multidrug efflux pump subunit AcrB
MTRFALLRPYTILVAVIALCLGGWMALKQMKRDIFPSLRVPTIYVAQPYGGMDSAQIEGFISYYYEYHFLYLTGLASVESKCIQGATLIKLTFHPGTDMASAMGEVVGYVNRSRAFMPPGTVPPFVTRFDTGSVAVGQLVFSSESKTVAQLQDAALNVVRPLFAPLPGVSAPPPFGGSARAIVLNLKPDRLRALNLSPDEVVQAIAQSQTIIPSGNVTLGDEFPMVPMNGIVKNIKDLETIPLRTTASGAVFVRDVAEAADAADLTTSYGLVNGRRTVYMPVTKRADASTLDVIEVVKANIPKFKAAVPEGISVSYEMDQSHFVTSAIADLVKEGWMGAILTGLMVLLFLRDLRSALIVVINIPLALLASLLGLWACGQTINLMTVGGMALAVGILVDEATVTIENIHRRMKCGKAFSLRDLLHASNETSTPRLLAMLCIFAVFAPALVMQGAAQALFVPLSLAVAFAMLASYLLSSTLVPVLVAWTHRTSFAQEEAPSVLEEKAAAFIQKKASAWAVAGHGTLLMIYLGICGVVLAFLYPQLGNDIFPQVDRGQLQLRYRAATGTKLDKSEAIALSILDEIKTVAGSDNIKLTMALVGVHAPSFPVNLIHQWNGGPEEGVLQIEFKREAKLSLSALREKLRASLKAKLPSVRVSFEPGDIVTRVMSLGSPTPIEVAVTGPSLTDDEAHAKKILAELEKLPFLRDLQFNQALDYPTVEVAVNREKAGLAGVSMTDAGRALVTATSSSRFTTPVYWADPKTGQAFQVQVQVPPSKMNHLDEIRNLPVASKGGSSTLLRNLATISLGSAVETYERINMARTVSITANLHGIDLGAASKQVAAAVSAAGAPPAKTNVLIRGQSIPLEQTQEGLRNGLLIAIVAIFLLLAAYFQSLRLPLVTLITVPAALAGSATILFLMRETLNIQSYIGIIMAVGVAMANSILLVSFAQRHFNRGLQRAEAASLARRERLRPILMTSLAMIAGMIPMAMGLGEAGAQTAPLGRAVIGGLVAVTFATLLILPAAFSLFAGKAQQQREL